MPDRELGNHYKYFIDGIDADPVLAMQYLRVQTKDMESPTETIAYRYWHHGAPQTEDERNISPDLLVPVDIVERGKQAEAQPQQSDTGDPLSMLLRGAIASEVERQISHIVMQPEGESE